MYSVLFITGLAEQITLIDCKTFTNFYIQFFIDIHIKFMYVIHMCIHIIIVVMFDMLMWTIRCSQPLVTN